jgi:PilZ domain
MDGTGTHDRARLKTTTTTWAALKRLYLKPERPRARRYSFVASIELTDLQSETHFTEQTSNLSLFGCHVDTGKLLLAGIRVRVRIAHTGASFIALGRVVYASADAGIGVVFTEIEPSHQSILEKWITQVRRRAPERTARFLVADVLGSAQWRTLERPRHDSSRPEQAINLSSCGRHYSSAGVVRPFRRLS